MTIVYVKEVAGRTGISDREFTRTNTLMFRVKSDRPDESEVAIRRDSRVPKPWLPHPREPFVFCDTVKVTQQKNKIFWMVEADYTSDVDGEEEKKNPLDRKADISWSSRQFTELATEDNDGNPILNDAGDPPEGGGLLVQSSHWVINVEKKLSHIPQKLVLDEYDSSVNEDTVRIDGFTFDPGVLKVMGLRIGKNDVDQGVKFRQVSLEYHVKPKLWTQTMLNRGFNQLVSEFLLDADGELFLAAQCREKILIGSDDGRAGEPPTEAAMLDEFGGYIEKPSREIRFIKGGTVKEPSPLPDDPDEREKELKKRNAIIFLTWDVEKTRQFRGVLPLS